MANSISRQKLTFIFIAAVFIFMVSGVRFALAQTDYPVGVDYSAIETEQPVIVEQTDYPIKQPWWKRFLDGAGKLIEKLWGGAEEIGLWLWDGLKWIYVSATDAAVRLVDWWNGLPLWLQLLIIALGLVVLVRVGLQNPSDAATSFGGWLRDPVGKILTGDPEKGFACNPTDHYIALEPMTYVVRKRDYLFGKNGEEVRAAAIREAEERVIAKLKYDLLKRAAAYHCSGDCEKTIHNLETEIVPPTSVRESHTNLILWRGWYEATAKAKGSIKVKCSSIKKTP